MQDEFIDQDVWGLYREADTVEVVVLFVRAGKLVGRRAFQQKDQELPDAAVIAEHVQQYYATGTFIPDEVVVGVDLEDSDTLAEWLRRSAARRCSSSSRAAARARASSSSRIATPRRAATSRRRQATPTPRRCSQKVGERLGLPRPPQRIECFDIAHIQGTETVASMVTFVDGVPARGLYRKFKVRSVEQRRLRGDVRGADAPVPAQQATTIRRGRGPTCSSSTAARASSAWRSRRSRISACRSAASTASR